MPKITVEISPELARHIERIVRDGWFPNPEELMGEALRQFVEAKSFLGDSPRLLHRFAADALNESKPETALKFASRGLALLDTEEHPDLAIYQRLVELKVQILLVLDRSAEALDALEEAKQVLPNSPAIARWAERVRKSAPAGSSK
jgi:Arc/MetJ-type ribon-helix-helix transcriptional regulator